MKLTKKFLVGVVTLVLVLAMVMPVAAANPPTLEDLQAQLQALLNSQSATQDQINALLSLIGQQPPPPEPPPPPTPDPVFAPNPRLVSPQNITVTAGETLDVALTIRNIGTHTAFNYLLQAAPNGPFTVEFLNNSNSINSITENRNITVNMRITVNAGAETGNHTIALTHNFRTQDRDNEARTDTPIHVRVIGADDATRPNLEIRNITTPTGNVNVNGTATISFYVHNAGSSIVRNIQVAASPENTDIVPVQTASTQSIPSLAPGESHRLTFNFSPRTSATTRSYSIGFTVTSGDTEFSQFASINVFNPDEDDTNQATLEIRGLTAPTDNIGVNEVATISFYVYNTSDSIARNVSVVAAPENTDVVPVQTASRQSIPTLAPGESHRLTFSFSPRGSATTRSYSIGFTVSHAETDFSQFAAINVFNPDQDGDLANLIIRNVNAPTGRVNVGSTATISFYVENTGEGVARNIRVEATPESTSAIVPVQTANTQTIASLAPGESQRLTFSFSPTDSATTRSYAVGFVVNHAGENFSQFAAINAYNPDEDSATGAVQIPRVIISNTRLTPEVPRAGQPFEMEITFRNTSANRSVNNVRVLMEEVIGQSAPNQPAPFAGFTRIDGSNTLIIDDLAARGEVTMTLRFNTVVDATPGSHNMRFSFDYQDQEFAEFTATEQISISVAQFSRMELRDVEISPWDTPMVGVPVRFNYVIINSGRVNLINVRTSAEGPFEGLAEAGMFLGQINAQRTTTFTGTFIPIEPGRQRGYFVITAEDQTGEIVELRHEFYVEVEGGMDFDGGMFEGGMFEGGGMGMEMGRPFIQEYEWCPDAQDMVSAGYWGPDGEWVPTGERCFETGAWIQFGGGGFDFLGLIRRPVVWGPAIGVVVIAAIVVVVVVNKKKTKFNFMDDDE